MYGIKQVRNLFSVAGCKLGGHAIELIIAKSEAEAQDYAVRNLGFVRVDNISLASDCVHVLVRDQN